MQDKGRVCRRDRRSKQYNVLFHIVPSIQRFETPDHLETPQRGFIANKLFEAQTGDFSFSTMERIQIPQHSWLAKSRCFEI